MTQANPSPAKAEKTSNINGQKILLWAGVIFLVVFLSCYSILANFDFI